MNARDFVRIGDYVFPKRVQWRFEGAKGDPNLRATFEYRNGRPQCIDVQVTATDDGRLVRSSDLIALEVDKMTTVAFSRFAMRSSFNRETNVTTMEPVDDEREFWEVINHVEAAVKAPRRGVTTAEIQRVAEIYLREAAGDPTTAVQLEMDYGSRRTAERRIKQAEEAGLLPATTPGKRRAR